MIHQTAVIDKDAVLGERVTVGPYSVIGAGVEIGDGSHIGPHVVIEGPTKIGLENRIYQFCSIGAAPQDKKYADEETRLVIGDRNTIRECCTFNRGTAQDKGETRIGDDNWVMAYAHVAHDCIVGNNIILANGATLAGHVEVGNFAIMGGYSGAHQFCRIGAHSFLGMYAGINRDVPPYVMVAGQPATPRGINSEGLKRRGFSAEQISNLRSVYRLIYRSGQKLSAVTDEIATRAADGQSELNILLEFLRSGTRGIQR